MNNNRVLFAIFAAFAVTGCATYPRQSKGTLPVLPIKSYFTVMPRKISMGGGMTRLMDDKKKAWAFFKGPQDDSLLNAMDQWLDKYVDEGEDSTKTPIIIYTATDVNPLTLLTRKDLKGLSKTTKDQLIEMTRYRTYSITIPIFTYAELLTPEQQSEYHLTVTTSGSSNQTGTGKSGSTNSTKSPGDRSSVRRLRRG